MRRFTLAVALFPLIALPLSCSGDDSEDDGGAGGDAGGGSAGIGSGGEGNTAGMVENGGTAGATMGGSATAGAGGNAGAPSGGGAAGAEGGAPGGGAPGAGAPGGGAPSAAGAGGAAGAVDPMELCQAICETETQLEDCPPDDVDTCAMYLCFVADEPACLDEAIALLQCEAAEPAESFECIDGDAFLNLDIACEEEDMAVFGCLSSL